MPMVSHVGEEHPKFFEDVTLTATHSAPHQRYCKNDRVGRVVIHRTWTNIYDIYISLQDGMMSFQRW